MAWLTPVLYLACLTHFPVVIARGIPDPRRRGDMKAEEEVDLVDKVHTGSKGTSNITSYRRNIENKRDIQYFLLSKKYFKQEGHLISLQIHEIFPRVGMFNIPSYP